MELKEGDKVRIVCADGKSDHAVISFKGQGIPAITEANIKIIPNSYATVELHMISLVIDIEAEVTKIVDTNPKLTKIRQLIDHSHVPCRPDLPDLIREILDN